MKKGKLHCWEAEGPAKQVFEELRPQITSLLEIECGPVPSSSFVLFDIFMIGETKATTLPHIMFSCKRREPRKAAVAAIRQSNILDQYPPGIYLGDWDYPPYLKDLRFLMFAPHSLSCLSSNENQPIFAPQTRPSMSTLYHSAQMNAGRRPLSPINPPSGTGYSTPGKVDHNPQIMQSFRALQLILWNSLIKSERLCTATIGAVMILSGRRFYLAPAHICYPQELVPAETATQVGSGSDGSECDFEGFGDADERPLDSGEADLTSRYSLTPGSSNQDADWGLSQDDSISEAQSESLTPAMKNEGENIGASYTSRLDSTTHRRLLTMVWSIF